jgi:hypothetical protein
MISLRSSFRRKSRGNSAIDTINDNPELRVPLQGFVCDATGSVVH